MARSFLTAINLNQNELQNARVQNLATPPSVGTEVKGQLYFNSTGGNNTLYWWDGSQWIAAKGAAGATPAGTVTTQAVGDAPVVGISTNYAREDHKHGREAFGAAVADTTFGSAKVDGVATTIARSDHIHGNPVHDSAAHSAIPISALGGATGTVNMNGNIIANLAAPSSGTDATNKTYVDNAVAGLSWKDAVRIATTANLAALAGNITVDGVAVANGDRILVKDQTTPAQNGVYVGAAGAWTRSTDADTATELDGLAVFVEEGTANQDTAWVCTTNAPITVGTTGLTFVQFAGGGAVVAGAGMTQSGNTLNVIGGTGITVNADNIQLTDMAQSTIRGRANAAGTGSPQDLTGTQATAILDVFTLTLKGLVPGGGSASQMLRGDASWATAVPATRAINTTLPLTGGGDVSADRTLAVNTFGSAQSGVVPASGGSATNFLRADGVWAAPNTSNLARKFGQTLSTSATSYVVNHALNTSDVMVQVYRSASPSDTVECDVERTDGNNVTLRFTTAPAANDYRVMVFG
jgi:hypothetical protein